MANPAYDDQVEQIHEVEKLKVELARKGVQATVDTLKRGMVLPDRDNPETSDDRKYLRGDEFLMVNPHAKDKKSKSKKHGGRRGPSRRRSTLAEPASPRSPSKKRRAGSADSDNLP